MTDEALGASFRDPSGFVFERDGVLYRRIHRVYARHYDRLMTSGLYAELVRDGLLIPHEEIENAEDRGNETHRTIRPQRIDFISYPYEWCFGQLKDAALATLRAQQKAMRFDMILKDASAYNVQFHGGRPTLIDTLSFELYEEGLPWMAHRQFCEHFLAPLALMAHRDVRLGRLLRTHLDGIPLDLARVLLPGRAWLNVHLLLHIRFQAWGQRRYAFARGARKRARPVSRRRLADLVRSLESALRGLDWKPEGTAWADYGEGDSYTPAAREHKRKLVAGILEAVAPRVVWDLGANVGEFSRIASARGMQTVAFDADPACVERTYREIRRSRECNLLPLWLDLANPSPALGWAHRERASLLERRSADLLMALALIHHLAIAHNVPLERIAELFAELAPHLIVEFVPKDDPKVRALLANREDVFRSYSKESFERAFGQRFEIAEASPIAQSERILYWMRRRDAAAAATGDSLCS